MEAKYGYTIMTTPGIITDGSFPLSLAGFLAGKIEKAIIGEPCFDEIPVWGSKEEAELAMLTIVPHGHDPRVYAGLSVVPAWGLDEAVVRGCLRGMNKFSPAKYK